MGDEEASDEWVREYSTYPKCYNICDSGEKIDILFKMIQVLKYTVSFKRLEGYVPIFEKLYRLMKIEKTFDEHIEEA
jgi:hypothetical protein